jgi:putative ABC transport system permease protein
MKLWGLVWANLFRKRLRTFLTLASLAIAFLLFGFLQSLDNVFSGGADFIGASRLITQARISFTQALPMRQLQALERTPGVQDVSYAQWFGGIYQEPKNFFPQFAVDPERFFKVYPEWVLPDAQKQRFINIRASAIVGQRLAEKFKWKVGDQIPLTSSIWPTQTGDKLWSFEVAGIFTGKDEEWATRANLMYLNFNYFDEERQFGRGGAGIFAIRLKPDAAPETVAKAIDTQFMNSPDETKTQTEKDFNLGFVRQLGDISLIIKLVLGAVFFTILLVVGNTMAQSVRERTPELAVLKTLGFTDAAVLLMVLAESALICFLGMVIGMLMAVLAFAVLGKMFQFPETLNNVRLWLQAGSVAFVLALIVGVLPAWRARGLKIVDALAGR